MRGLHYSNLSYVIFWRAGWPGKVDHSKPAGRFFRNRPWRGKSWLWIGPYVIGNVKGWEDA